MNRIARCTARLRPALEIPPTFVLLPLVLVASLSFPGISSPARAVTGFIENQGQVDSRVLYYASGAKGAVFFTREGIVVDIREECVRGERAAKDAHLARGAEARVDESRPAVVRGGRSVWVRLGGTNRTPDTEARGELDTKYHFFLGGDPSRWRTNVRAFREIIYRDIRPGVDLVCTEKKGRVTYEIHGPADGSSSLATEISNLADFTSSMGGLASPAGNASSLVDDPGFLSWGTFLGGNDLDGGVDVALDASGNVYVLGETYSLDFPATPGAHDSTYSGWTDMFIGKLSPDGSTLVWGTYLGSGDMGVADTPTALALDALGNLVVTGSSSFDYPTTAGAYDTTWNSWDDVVVTKLSPDGSSILWSTFVGGNDYDFIDALTLDASGHAILSGGTYSADYPTTAGAYDQIYAASGNVFVSKLSSNGSTLLWSTFVGGPEGGEGADVVLDASGNPIVTGYASSAAFPTTAGAYDVTWNGRDDVFVSKLSADGSSLLWSTFLGGDGDEEGVALAVDPSGRVVVAGNTGSASFPTTSGVYQPTWKGRDDVFVAVISANGSSLAWSTFLGGANDDRVRDMALDSEGRVVLAGMIFSTSTSDFPTTPRTLDGSFNGGGLDGFVSRLWANGGFLSWSSFIGGSGADEVRALALTAFDDPVLTGTTDSSDFPATPGALAESLSGTYSDAFAVRLDFEEPTGIEDAQTPSLGVLLPCAPNPFAQATRIRYALEEETSVDLRVFDVTGRVVGVLDAGRRPAGVHDVAWDGRSDGGEPVAAGVYFVRLTAGGKTFTQKIAVVR